MVLKKSTKSSLKSAPRSVSSSSSKKTSSSGTRGISTPTPVSERPGTSTKRTAGNFTPAKTTAGNFVPAKTTAGNFTPAASSIQTAAARALASQLENASGPSGMNTNYSSGSSSPQYSSSPVAAAPVSMPEITAMPNANYTPVAPQITAPTAGAPSDVGSFSTAGGNGNSTFGMLQRLRQNRGPRTGTSITPELLRRLAAQQFRRQ